MTKPEVLHDRLYDDGSFMVWCWHGLPIVFIDDWSEPSQPADTLKDRIWRSYVVLPLEQDDAP